MTNFDQILKKGIDSVTSTPSTTDQWERAIGLILHSLQQFNNMYPDHKNHHIAVKHTICKKCKTASFIALVRNKDDPKQLMKFHLSDWKSTNYDKDEYMCGKCK